MRPRSSNTGAETANEGYVSVDYLEGYTRRTVEEVKRLLASYGIGDWRDMATGALGYGHRAVGTGEAALLWSEKRDTVHVTLRGAACRLLSNDQMRGLLLYMRTQFVITRLDLAGDDYTRNLLPEDLHGWQLSGAMVTHAQRWELRQSGGLGGGSSFSVGTRGSRQFLRVYDKGAESNGEKDCIRFELECRDEMAQQVGSELTTHQWGKVWACRVGSYVSFRDPRELWRTGDRGHMERAALLPEWAALLGSFERWKAYSPEKWISVAKVRRWIERQVAPGLALCLEADDGPEKWLFGVLDAGKERWTRGHEEALSAALEAA